MAKHNGKKIHNLEISWREGIGANIMLVVMDYYLLPFGIFLGATPQEIGFLVAFPHLFGALSQLFANQIISKVKSRLHFMIGAAFLQACILIPMALLSFFFSEKIKLLILFAMFFRILGNLIGTAWGSLMSEYLNPNERGDYFGWRSQIVGIAGVLAMLAAGGLLYYLAPISAALAYLILFLFIAVCRFISTYYLAQMTDLPFKEPNESAFSFIQFIQQFKRSNFVKFVLYVAAITFSTQLAAPFFSVYMLTGIHFSYAQYMLVHLICMIAGLASFRIWGHHADHVGNARVLKITGYFLPVIPLLWLLNGNIFYIMFIECLAGFLWSGFNLAAANFIFDAVSPSKRVRCLGYFNFICGISIFCGASLGGYLAKTLPDIFGHPLLTLFALSGILRLVSNALLGKNFKEIRPGIHHSSSHDLFFSVLGIRPMLGRNRERNIFTILAKPKFMNKKAPAESKTK